MPRPFSEKLRDPVWWLEQAAHFTVFGLVAFGVGWLNVYAGSVVAFLAPVGYELVQNLGDEDNDYLDMAADLAFSWLGGATGVVIAALAF